MSAKQHILLEHQAALHLSPPIHWCLATAKQDMRWKHVYLLSRQGMTLPDHSKAWMLYDVLGFISIFEPELLDFARSVLPRVQNVHMARDGRTARSKWRHEMSHRF